jgi:hypothetical protein
MSRFLLAFCLCLPAKSVFSQIFGGNPPSLKWKKISTDSARIIFPEGLDTTAQRVAAVVHYLAAKKPLSLGNDIHKINIVLQNQSTIGNGYVGLGPYRSEFFLTPILNNFSEGSIAWPDQLAIHEYRHVQQFNNFRNGISRVMWRLFGEEGLALAINASVPDWFYEGDAVHSETVLTQQGRGRIPQFLNTYPSLWQSNKNYSWMKLRNGSLKDYVPSHYHLGYLMVNYGYEKYGKDFWQKVTHDASAYRGLFYPFQNAIKKQTGLKYRDFYTEAFNYYKEKRIDTGLSDKIFTTANLKYIKNYLFPYRISEDSLLYLRTSYRHRPAFFIRDKEGDHKLRIKDISIDNQYSYRNGKVVYAAYETDLRWGWRDYSVIRILDIATKKQRTIGGRTMSYYSGFSSAPQSYEKSPRSKYFTPDISPDGSKVAAVHINSDGKTMLHILDVSSGDITAVIQSADIMLFTDPKFIDDNSIVTAVRLTDGKMALALAEISSGNTMRLTNPSYNIVGYPSVNNGVIYFTASYEGNDDVFALRMADKKIYKISNGQFGNYQVNASNGKITWTTFTADGYQLVEINESDIPNNPAVESNATLEMLAPKFDPASPPTSGDILTAADLQRKFDITRYKKGTRLLNFHSWRPYYEDPLFTFSLYGENILNTLQSELYYLYNENEKTHAAGFNTTYGAWFPWVSAGAEYTFNRKVPVGSRTYQWDQLDSRIGLNVPLNFTSGRSYKQLNIGTNYFYRLNVNKGFLKDSLDGNTGFSYLHHYFSWAQQVPMAVQHIYPKWGYAFSGAYRYAITDLDSWQFNGNTSIYLPGIASNHSLVATGSFQEVDTLVTAFGNRFPYSRGYVGRYFSRMWRISGNYHFPIWHTDWGFANIAYLQRLRANFFYDFTKVYSRNKTQSRNQRSIGAEFYADTKWWNQHPLTFGFRITKLLDADQYDGYKGMVYEFIMPISIIPR